MKAYYRMARNRKKSGMKLLQKSKKLAEKDGNRAIYNWADHCEKVYVIIYKFT
jgi:hypothetical protein